MELAAFTVLSEGHIFISHQVIVMVPCVKGSTSSLVLFKHSRFQQQEELPRSMELVRFCWLFGWFEVTPGLKYYRTEQVPLKLPQHAVQVE